jgi:hypothetical protein
LTLLSPCFKFSEIMDAIFVDSTYTVFVYPVSTDFCVCANSENSKLKFIMND